MFIATTASNLHNWLFLGARFFDCRWVLSPWDGFSLCISVLFPGDWSWFKEIGSFSRRLVLFLVKIGSISGDWFDFYTIVLFQGNWFYFKEIGFISRTFVLFKRLVLFLDDWFYFKEIGSTSISRRLILFQKDLFYF